MCVIMYLYMFTLWIAPDCRISNMISYCYCCFSSHYFFSVDMNFPLISAGGGRTGVFIAISTAIERYLQEKLIDVFDLVKNLRNQRPAMVKLYFNCSILRNHRSAMPWLNKLLKCNSKYLFPSQQM